MKAGRMMTADLVIFNAKVRTMDESRPRAIAVAVAWLSCGFVKMFMDGGVDSRTAYMLHAYPGTGKRGEPLFDAVRSDLNRDRPARVADCRACHWGWRGAADDRRI